VRDDLGVGVAREADALVLELAPQGDVAAADALDKVVAADVKSGDKALVAADNTVAQVAWRLRVRGQ